MAGIFDAADGMDKEALLVTPPPWDRRLALAAARLTGAGRTNGRLVPTDSGRVRATLDASERGRMKRAAIIVAAAAVWIGAAIGISECGGDDTTTVIVAPATTVIIPSVGCQDRRLPHRRG